MAQKRNKTRLKLLSLTPTEREEIGREMERLINNELAYIVNKYRASYRKAVLETFGWDQDDLMQYIRMCIWKGLATFDRSKNFKATTYISSILRYRMANLAKACQTKKHSQSKLYCTDTLFDCEELTEYENPESAYESDEIFQQFDRYEWKVFLFHVVNDVSIKEIMEMMSINREEVHSVLENVKNKLEAHR